MATPFPMEPLTPERRRELTREHLLQAAARIFAERGFHGATLDEVASVAGFTKGAVYSNFRNKEDLFLALLSWIYTQEMEALRETLRSSQPPADAPYPESRLTDFVDLLKRQRRPEAAAGGADWSVLYEEFHLYALRNPAVREKLVELDNSDIDDVARVIEGERERLGLRPLESAADAARIVVALMRGVGMMRSLDPQLAEDDHFLQTVMAFVARGLTSAPES